MKVYDIQGLFLCDSEEDAEEFEKLIEKGQMVEDQRVKEHHDEVEAKPAVTHLEPKTVYFTDGTSQEVTKDDPHISIGDNGVPQWNALPEDNKEFFGMDIEEVVDEESTEAFAAYDEMESYLKYIPYTEDEIRDQENRKKVQEMLDQSPSLLDDMKQYHEDYREGSNHMNSIDQSIEDLTLMNAEFFGGEASQFPTKVDVINLENDMASMGTGMEDITLLLAEMVGVE